MSVDDLNSKLDDLNIANTSRFTELDFGVSKLQASTLLQTCHSLYSTLRYDTAQRAEIIAYSALDMLTCLAQILRSIAADCAGGRGHN